MQYLKDRSVRHLACEWSVPHSRENFLLHKLDVFLPHPDNLLSLVSVDVHPFLNAEAKLV